MIMNRSRPYVTELSEVSQMTSKMTSEKCNEPRSEELCGSGRKFQLSWKAKYNWIAGQTPCLLFSLYKCCKVANAPSNYITREGFICSICSKTQIIPAVNNDPRTVKLHSCHSEIVKNLDSNQLLDEFFKKAPSCTHECFLSHNAT